jgi:aspartyl-tRNA(Asn)/glutamyl-tRNA(Gln) amidotransferase subunit A
VTAAHWLEAAELAAAYRARRTVPTEIVQALLDRTAALDPKIHAFIRVDAERAMDAARAAEAEMAAGAWRGPLHGVPVGVKDVIDVAGLPTTGNSKILLDNMPAQDADVVARLRATGAIVLGKLNTHEFAIGGPSFDLPFPPPRNPWHLDHHVGGSSSGSGAGLSGGLFPLALGTDAGGSVRHPAGRCGVVGLKATFGRLSRRGVLPVDYTQGDVGPMARSVRDAALMLDAMDEGGTARRPDGGSFAAGLGGSVKGLRVGFVRHFHETDVVADPEVTAAIDRAAAVLRDCGAEIRDVTLPPLTEFVGVNRVLLYSEVWAACGDMLRTRARDLCELNRRRMLAGAFLSGADYIQAQRARGVMIAAVNDVFREVDILLTASALDPTCRLEDPETMARTYSRQAWLPFNVTGHPAIVLMAGLSKNGLPLSVQFVGPAFCEDRLVTLAGAYEQAAGWYGMRPTGVPAA